MLDRTANFPKMRSFYKYNIGTSSSTCDVCILARGLHEILGFQRCGVHLAVVCLPLTLLRNRETKRGNVKIHYYINKGLELRVKSPISAG